MSRKGMPDGASPVTYRFSDIGPVKDASLQLGRLTVIAGRNNTGKTYLTYSLYGFLKTWSAWPGAADFVATAPDVFPNMRSVAETLRSRGQASVPLPISVVSEQRQLLMNQVSTAFSKENLRRVFSSRRNDFGSARVGAETNGGVSQAAPHPATLSVGPNALSMTHDGDLLTVAMQPSHRADLDEHLHFDVAWAYFVLLLRDIFPDPFILSAERFGISLFYRELDFTKNQLVDVLQKLGDEGTRGSVSPYLVIDRTTSRYALPIKDNIDFTRGIPDLKDPSDLASHKLFDQVKNLIDGYYGNATEDIRFISKARGKGRSFNIPLHLASSSARGLSDFYFFLRYVATEGQLLIIDEPENHLDTRNQILLARLLSRLVATGLQVLITTHSDYLIKELNNLIMLARDFPDKEAVAKKLGYQPGEGLEATLVRAYVAEDGGLTECDIDAYGMNMPMFDRVIDDINNAANQLSSRAAID